jgi:hypothetical protein
MILVLLLSMTSDFCTEKGVAGVMVKVLVVE